MSSPSHKFCVSDAEMNCLLGSEMSFSLLCLQARQAKLTHNFPEFYILQTNVDKLDLPKSEKIKYLFVVPMLKTWL